MEIKKRFEQLVRNRMEFLEIKCNLLALMTLSGVLSGVEKKNKKYKIGFVLSDSLLIMCLLFEFIYNIKEERGRGKNE